MNLDKITVNLEKAFGLLEEITESKDYNSLIEQYPDLEFSDINHAKSYIEGCLVNFEEVKDLEFVKTLDLDKCIPLTEDMYNRAMTLTEGVEVKLEDELMYD